MSQSAADSFIADKVAPQVTWTAREALDRCLNNEPWTLDIPRIVDNALRIRRLATTRISRICEIFGLSLVWDPSLLSIPACSCFKLPAAFHLIYKLRHFFEVLLRLKSTERDLNIYDRESSLRALQHMTGGDLTEWTNLMRSIFDWGKSTMALIHAAQFRRNVFAPEFLAVFRLAFVFTKRGWSNPSVTNHVFVTLLLRYTTNAGPSRTPSFFRTRYSTSYASRLQVCCMLVTRKTLKRE